MCTKFIRIQEISSGSGLLENTGRYIHVRASVDDGGLPPSIRPLTDSFIS
ncbi:MAG TPA: hypothetical protein VNH83_05385 [Bryobacteraceae bacterium]|nr:hypothetical protein [Bryobacteraceae bacterium]